jgi:pteridine reductase
MPSKRKRADMDGSLSGKTVLITGGARRVGAELARTLHVAGANIVLHYRRSSGEATRLAKELNDARPRSAALVQADLLETTKFRKLSEATVAAFGQLDVLINNASSFYPTQALAPALRMTQGLILNLADIHGMRPLRRYTTYCVAKAGLIMLTKSLARELGPHVRVNAIAPGPVMWPEDGTDRALQKKIIDRTLLKRSGSPEDVARAALFFCTQAPYVTGQILAVDGGRSVGW